MIELDLAQFATAVRAHALRWENAGIRWQLTFGPERAKSAAQVACGYPAQRAVMTLPLAAAKVDHTGEEA